MSTCAHCGHELTLPPGPWRDVGTGIINDRDGKCIAYVQVGPTTQGVMRQLSALIAAAPEMLEALKCIQVHFARGGFYLSNIADKVSAAIKRAEGT